MAIRLTGSLSVLGGIEASSGSFSGSFTGDGSGLTNIPGGNAFPHTGSAIISGSQEVSGSVEFSYPATSPSAWTAGGALITARCALGGAGTQDAGLAFGGRSPAPLGQNIVGCTEEYNGSSWSAGGALINRRRHHAGAGTQTSALAAGGFLAVGSIGSCTEEYNEGPINFTKTFDYSSTTGETTVSCLIETSAERYKDNIQPMGSQLNKVMQLKPVEFDWKSNKKHDIGFVADSVKNVYPNLVSEKDGKVEGMNYSKLVSALVKSIQEQQTQIDELKTRLDNNN